jgi:iron complex outermembrane receptor protein
MMSKKLLRAVFALFLGLMVAGAVFAQESEPAAEPEAAAEAEEAAAQEADKTLMEEIVVTAQKREQSLQDVPISITVFSQQKMQDFNLDNMQKLQDYTPNMRINRGTATSAVPQYAIRGVGNNSNTDEINSSPVTSHVNEVARAFPITSEALLFDIERVEVLRGPQGDLFGLNTTGGTVNFITAKPTDQFTAGIYSEAGNYGYFKLDGYVSGPLSDKWSARFAAATVQMTDGWQEHETTGEKTGEQDKGGARLSIRHSGNKVMADIDFNYSWDNSDVRVPRLVEAFTGIFGEVSEAVQGGDRVVRWSRESGFGTDWDRPRVDHTNYGLTAKIDWDVGAVSLVSVTGALEFDGNRSSDLDGHEQKDADVLRDTNVRSFSQEFRVVSNKTDPVGWILGVYYADDTVDNFYIFDLPEQPDFFAVGNNDTDQNRTQYAVFGHIDWNISSRLQLSGGLRYTNERREIINRGTALTFDSWGIWGSIGGYEAGDILTDSITGCFFLGDCTPGVPFEADIEDSDSSGKLVLNWAASNAWNLYGSVSKGFKSGGFNDSAASVSEQFAPYEPERLWAYEVGAKGSLVNGTMGWNSAVFYYDYEDMQTGDSIVDPLFAALGAIVNAPEVKIWGIETELFWQATGNFLITQGIGYKKGEFGTFQAVDGDAVREQINDPDFPGFFSPVYVDLTGETVGFPELEYNGLLEYRIPTGDTANFRIAVDYSYQDATTTIGEGRVLPSFFLLNGRLVYQFNNGLELGLWGRNLTDEIYLESFERWNQSLVEMRGMTQTFGVSLRWTY